jgi:hypothetical protein
VGAKVRSALVHAPERPTGDEHRRRDVFWTGPGGAAHDSVMGWFEQSVNDFGGYLSRVLTPVTIGIDFVDRTIQHQLTLAGVPFRWQSVIVTALWTLVLFMLVRSVRGWVRLATLVVVSVVLAKVYGILPSN